MLDPASIRAINDLIDEARQRAKRVQAKRRAQKQERSLANRLPIEIILSIADYLPSEDVVIVQKMIGQYMGDRFWRSRTPQDNFFHEVRALASEEHEITKVDWEYLCMGLEELDPNFGIDLLGRQYILAMLDDAIPYIPQSHK